MADLRDERGNPIQLADEYGNPVQLRDEFGNPMHLSGVAKTTTVVAEAHVIGSTGGETLQQKLHRSGTSSSSSSSSSEDDGQGGRRKKKGLKEKIKDKLPVGSRKQGEDEGYYHAPGGGPGPITMAGAAPTYPLGEQPHVHHPPEKKGILEKIKEKLPGHHHH